MQKLNVLIGGLALAVLLGLAVVVWLLRSEGEKNRAALREAAATVGEEIGDGVRDGIADGLSDAIESAPGQVLRQGASLPQDVFGTILDEILKQAPTEGEGGEPDATQVGPGDLFDLGTDLFDDVVDQVGKLPGMAPEMIRFLNRDVLRPGEEALGQLLGANISEEEENALGAYTHRAHFQKDVVDLQPLQQHLTRLAEPLIGRCQRGKINYEIFIINRRSFNAFAILGGKIYVHTGLLKYVNDNYSEEDDRDRALQFLLGHEIAHVELRHCSRSLKYSKLIADKAGSFGSQIARTAYDLVSRGYSQDYETEADLWSYRGLRQLGVPKADCLLFARLLVKHAQQHRGHPAEDPVSKSFEVHMRTHPPARDRLARLQKET